MCFLALNLNVCPCPLRKPPPPNKVRPRGILLVQFECRPRHAVRFANRLFLSILCADASIDGVPLPALEVIDTGVVPSAQVRSDLLCLLGIVVAAVVRPCWCYVTRF
jgi:hypothetical protein